MVGCWGQQPQPLTPEDLDFILLHTMTVAFTCIRI